MDILFLLVPLSVLLALAVMGVLAWAVWSGQFEELEGEGQRIFLEDGIYTANVPSTASTASTILTADPAQKPASSVKTRAQA